MKVPVASLKPILRRIEIDHRLVERLRAAHRHPILIDSNNRILDGHRVWAVARFAGFTHMEEVCEKGPCKLAS